MTFKNNADCAVFIRAKHISFAGADEKTMIQQGAMGIIKILESVRKYIFSVPSATSVTFDAVLFLRDMDEPLETTIELRPIKGRYIKDGGWEYIERPRHST